MIVINARFLTQKLTGVQRFSIELSLRLKYLIKEELLFLTPHNIIHEDVASQLNAKIIGNNTGHLWEQIDLPLYLSKINKPLLVCFGNTAPIFYKNKIDTLHDITFIRYPNTFSRKFLCLYRFLIPLVVHSSKHIFTVSEFSKNEISAYYRIPHDRMSIVYNGVGELFKKNMTSEYKSCEKYIIAVSSIKENKNFKVAYDAYKEARQVLKDLKFYIVGDFICNSFNVQSDFIDSIKNDDGVRILGRITDEELVRYYSNARAFIFPSLYEGFGIPVLEAQACGCPVISSNSSSLPEVLCDSAVLCDPQSSMALAKSIIEVINNVDLANTLRCRGYENVQRFSWEREAKKILDILRKYE